MAGILYLCATPIGNLKDISFRVLEILKSVDVVAAEDTRNSIKLFNHFEINTPLTSYHEYNKVEKAVKLIEMLKSGQNIALITDAGTPGISDPGEVLVRMCQGEGITVTSLPGPVACIDALILSGFSTRRFVFEGFLPREKKERAEILAEIGKETRTVILYEAPHHLKGTLEDLRALGDERNIALCRELTKKYEEISRKTIAEAIEYYKDNEPRGEYVLVIEGLDKAALKEEEQKKWEEMTIEEHMAIYEQKGIDSKEAMKMVAKDRGVSKRDIYNYLHKN